MNSTNNIKSTLDSKMTILVIITILSSILGAWPYIALATVFLYIHTCSQKSRLKVY